MLDDSSCDVCVCVGGLACHQGSTYCHHHHPDHVEKGEKPIVRVEVGTWATAMCRKGIHSASFCCQALIIQPMAVVLDIGNPSISCLFACQAEAMHRPQLDLA